MKTEFVNTKQLESKNFSLFNIFIFRQARSLNNLFVFELSVCTLNDNMEELYK